ncbi:MAG: hypothetical protein ABI867_33765 [Kofleriaceae bacterium]
MPRALGILIAMTTVASAAPSVLVADVSYDFIDQNGFGWVASHGAITVTITFGAKPTLAIRGKRDVRDGQLTGGSASKSPDMKVTKWNGVVDESFPLSDVSRDTTGAITFKLDPVHDHLEARCVPAKPAGIARTTLYECTITGFNWHSVPNLPELHHPFILDANAKAKQRVLNLMSGKSRRELGTRALKLSPASP